VGPKDTAPTGACALTRVGQVPGQYAIRVGQWKLLVGHTAVWAGDTSGALCTLRTGVVSKRRAMKHAMVALPAPYSHPHTQTLSYFCTSAPCNRLSQTRSRYRCWPTTPHHGMMSSSESSAEFGIWNLGASLAICAPAGPAVRCPNGWTPAPESGLDPIPPPDVNCTSRKRGPVPTAKLQRIAPDGPLLLSCRVQLCPARFLHRHTKKGE
jgi:hypothetical protein